MAIRRGGDWGEVSPAPSDLSWFTDDRSAANHVAETSDTRLGLQRGDMARTLGASGDGPTIRFTIDLLRVTWEGERGEASALALAHVVVRRRRGWTGPIVAVMNGQYMGEWDVAPRGHPNDGRAELIEVDSTMSVGQRWIARRRLPLGTHVPHPSIRVATRDRAEWTFDQDRELVVDGVSMGGTRMLRVEVIPDGAEVWVR